MYSQPIPSKGLWIVLALYVDRFRWTWKNLTENLRANLPFNKKTPVTNRRSGQYRVWINHIWRFTRFLTDPMRHDPSSRFSVLRGDSLHIRWNRTASTSRGRCYLLSLCGSALWSISWISFWRRPGPFLGKYVLTVVALRLLSQFRFINVVLPFRHLGCLWISRVDERFQGNRTKYSFHRNTYTSSYSHSQAHWPRWRRPPTIESSSHFAQSLQTLHSPCALGVYYYAWRHPVADAARMSVKFTEYPVKL